MKKLGFGFMRLPLQDAGDQKSVDMEMLCQMVDTFLARGFTYFDTAYMYHDFESECFLKEALVKRHPRENFTVATKLPTMFLKEKADQERIFAEQLQKCGVDYFDYYLLHNLNTEHYAVAQKLESFAFLQQKKEEGKAKQIGFSYHDNAALLDEILTAHPEVDFVQLQVNYMDWENAGIQSRKCCETVRKHGKAIIVMEPVKGGTLATLPEDAEKVLKQARPEMSVPSWAIRFAASVEGVMMVLSGMSNLAQLEENTAYMQSFVPLSQEEYQALNKTVERIQASIAVPCTACRYCVAGCPKQIPIPDYFALYNAEKQAETTGFSVHQAYYDNYVKAHGRAADCIGCKQCEHACPQHLNIVELLKDVSERFDTAK